ncbi:hypothetical protein E8E13_006584 [Curvularia kusanoi]|uniref:Uncharacterized protein n=1 Tax=Curvularia kusanoi TaxID=90978 RepID=A0A9P4WC51_CURKU|nr:hypothetical protein E8E13_006584 [Curvularia kusanoi]
MKVYQLATLFGVAASAVPSLVGRDDGITTSVVYTTATYTITKCAASVANCPVASATEVFTSTTVMSVTTTICAATPGLGLLPPESAHTPSIFTLPVGPAGTTDTQPDSIPTSYPPGVSESGSAHIPSVPTSALSIVPLPSNGYSVSLISPNPSLPIEGTGSSSAPPQSGVPESSNAYTLPAQTSALPTGPTGTNTIVVPGNNPSESTLLPGSLTDFIPTSLPSGVPGIGASLGHGPAKPSTAITSGTSQPSTSTNIGAGPALPGVSGIDSSPGSVALQSSTAIESSPGQPTAGTNTGVGLSSFGSGATDIGLSSGYVSILPSTALESGSSRPLISTNTNAGPISFPSGASGPVASAGPTPTLPSTESVSGPSQPSNDINPGAGSNSTPLGASGMGPSFVYGPSQPSTAFGSSPGQPAAGTNTGAVPISGEIHSSVYGQSSIPINSVLQAVPTSGSIGLSVDSSSGTGTPSVSSDANAVPISGYPTLTPSAVPSGGSYTAGLPGHIGGISFSMAPGPSTIPGAPGASGSSSGLTYSATDTAPTSGNTASSASSANGIYPPSLPSDSNALPTSGINTAPSGLPSLAVPSYTGTWAVPISGYGPSSVTPSSSNSLSLASDIIGSAASPSDFPNYSGTGAVSMTGTVGTSTASVLSSTGPGLTGPSSGEYLASDVSALPTQGASIQPHPSGSFPAALPSSASTAYGTYPAMASVGSGSAYPGRPPAASTTAVQGITGVTGGLISTSTSYVTVPLPSSNHYIETETDAADTSRGTGYLPSGSGYPHSSSSANGTIIAPTPSYIEAPVNGGHMIAGGQSPLAAIIIALAFALFA